MFIGRSYKRDMVEKFVREHKEYVLSYHTRYVRVQGNKVVLRIYYNGVVRIGNRISFGFSEKAIKKYF